MKSFDNVYNKSKKQIINEQQKSYASDKAKLIATIKHEYGVQDFNSVSESERESYKSMIDEMWNPNTGINEKGIKFINESAAVLTEKSTDEQIEKFFKKEIKANAEKIVKCLVGCGECNCPSEVKANIEASTKRKLSNKTAKNWMYSVITDFVGSKIKSVKF